MQLRHLRCFFAVAEELHFSGAAERLHIEQSPLSQHFALMKLFFLVSLPNISVSIKSPTARLPSLANNQHAFSKLIQFKARSLDGANGKTASEKTILPCGGIKHININRLASKKSSSYSNSKFYEDMFC